MSGFGPGPLFEQDDEFTDPFKPGRDHVTNMKNQFIDGPRVRVKFASIPPVYICERCGGTQTIKLPKDVPQLEAELDEFGKDHLTCGGKND